MAIKRYANRTRGGGELRKGVKVESLTRGHPAVEVTPGVGTEAGAHHSGPRSVRSAARSKRYTSVMILLRLRCSSFWVDVRLREINGRWIASADTPDGPSLGLGKGAIEAVEHALQPFEGIVDELLASLPHSGLV